MYVLIYDICLSLSDWFHSVWQSLVLSTSRKGPSFIPWAKQFHLAFLSVSSVQFSLSVVSISLWPHGLLHARPPCPSPTPRVYPNSCPSSRWCHPAISSSVVPFSSCPQSLPASESFPMSQLFAWGGQSTRHSYTHTNITRIFQRKESTRDWLGEQRKPKMILTN